MDERERDAKKRMKRSVLDLCIRMLLAVDCRFCRASMWSGVWFQLALTLRSMSCAAALGKRLHHTELGTHTAG